MTEFEKHLIRFGDDAVIAQPISWRGRISEQQLEDRIVESPHLAGEELLVLGRQLTEFEEDGKRLDVLAVDRDGEIVLLELKVDDAFGVTDLQALGYAAAYANKTGSHFAATLRGWRERCGQTMTLEEAQAEIADFVTLDAFSDWAPSKHVRIKLIAPNFPRRVLATVKWLGDLYGVRIEAIRANLFEVGGELECSFERVLPLPGEEEFDLTVREREQRRREANTARRPDVINFLIAQGRLSNGDRLWLVQSVLPAEVRGEWSADDPRFSFEIDATDPDNPKLLWQPEPGGETVSLSPSTGPYHVGRLLLPDREFERYRAVANKFAVAPGGQTLKELADEHGWASNGAESSS